MRINRYEVLQKLAEYEDLEEQGNLVYRADGQMTPHEEENG